MSTNLQNLIANWKPRIEANQQAQHAASIKSNKYHYAIGLPATILTTIAGATLLTETNDPRIKIAVGVFGLIAAALSAVQTFYSYAKRAEAHRSASAQLGDVRRELEVLENFPPGSRAAEEEYVRRISERLSKLGETAPIVEEVSPLR